MECPYRRREYIAHLFAKIECAGADHHWEDKLCMPQSSLSSLQAQTLLKHAKALEMEDKTIRTLTEPTNGSPAALMCPPVDDQHYTRWCDLLLLSFLGCSLMFFMGNAVLVSRRLNS